MLNPSNPEMEGNNKVCIDDQSPEDKKAQFNHANGEQEPESKEDEGRKEEAEHDEEESEKGMKEEGEEKE